MKSIADIKAIRDKMQSQIVVRDKETTDEIRVVSKRGLHNVKVSRTGCLGMCRLEPIVEVYVPGQDKVTYCHVDADKAKNIIANHIVNGNICTEYLVGSEE